MPHECGHCLLLLLCSLSTVTVEHVSPIVGGLSKIGAQCLSIPFVGMLACTLYGPLPIFHLLSHSGCGATRQATAWDKHIIGIALIPSGGYQWFHCLITSVVGQTACCSHQFPLLGFFRISFNVVLNTELNLFHKALQIILQLNRDVIHIEQAFIGITKDRSCAVIGGDDDEAVGYVENIEGSITTRDIVRGYQL